MKKKKKIPQKGRGLQTFFIYTAIVFLVVLVSLSIKAVSVLKQSKYDGKNITIAVTQNDAVIKILGYNNIKNSAAVLITEDKNVSYEELGSKIGLIPDARVDVDERYSEEDPDALLTMVVTSNRSARTDLTIFDSLRLIFLAKSIQQIDRHESAIDPHDKEGDIDNKVNDLFSDDMIVSENLSIQIINTTDVPGLGKQLERVIVNKGGNVVAVTSTRNSESASKIKSTQSSYTTEKLKKMLKLSEEKITDEALADILIIIGEDYKKAGIL